MNLLYEPLKKNPDSSILQDLLGCKYHENKPAEKGARNSHFRPINFKIFNYPNWSLAKTLLQTLS